MQFSDEQRLLVMVDDAFGHWLAGFIDGEGCFTIVRYRKNTSDQFGTRFALKLRDDDRVVLEEIYERVGVGSLVPDRHRGVTRPGGKPALVWKLQSKATCMALVEILDKYPLRSKKARDYAIWREAVITWNAMPSLGRSRQGGGTHPLDWTRMERFYSALIEVRKYAVQ